MVDLKPCPFCGGKPTVRNQHDDERFGYRETWEVRCSQCFASAPGSSYFPYGEWVGSGKPNIIQDRDAQIQIAYDNWNRRSECTTPTPKTS